MRHLGANFFSQFKNKNLIKFLRGSVVRTNRGSSMLYGRS
uniref:Uncharacterized protein n=1 Tax=Arundo donax TaxID=35708 RepID=A0A0A9CIP2_ARUDO